MKDSRYPFALEPGTEIGGYRIAGVLGAGGFGITYRASNDITHKQVAIKEFYVREISTRDGVTVIVDAGVELETYEYALRKFQEEAQAVVTRFQHPYIIRGENFVRAHNTCYLVMEYVEGGNLDDWLRGRERPPAEAEIRPLFEKLFTAVDYIHRHNMMHRDLTPRNIMVRPNGDPVLIDFGAAGLGIDLGRSSKIVAQLRYAPPEQSDETASGIHGRYTDIFSLAGVLFRVVTGKTPMAPTSRLARLGHSHDEPRPADPQSPVATLVADPKVYSSAFLAGIDQGLQLDERRRPQSIAAFRVALGWADPQEAVLPDDADAVTEIMPPVALPPLIRPPAAAPVASSDAGLAETRLAPSSSDRTPPASTALDPTVALPHRHGAASGPAGPVDAGLAVRANVGLEAPVTVVRSRRLGRGWLIGGLVAAGAALVAVILRPEIRAIIVDFNAPPVVTPYRAAVHLNGHTLELSGYVPTPEVHAALRAAVPASFRIDDRLALARDAPPELENTLTGFLHDLDRMAVGTIDITDRTTLIEATALSPEVHAGLARDLARLVPAGEGSVVITPATVQPYRFDLAVTGPRSAPIAVATGFLPDDAARKAIAAELGRALPGLRFEDRTLTAIGSPLDIPRIVAALAARFGVLDAASLRIEDRRVRLDGAARDEAGRSRAVAPLDPVVMGKAEVTLAIAPPVPVVPLSYQFRASIADGTLTLSGSVPDASVLAEVLAAPHGTLGIVDQLATADGAPDHFADAARYAVAAAAYFEAGSIQIRDREITISGRVRRVADLIDMKARFAHDLPAGFVLKAATYELRENVPAQPCDRLALPPGQPDRPDGVAGIAVAAIDAARALPACKAAVDAYPNVRRFTTALAAANERSGNYAEALRLYRLAAEADDASAMARLGRLYRDGLGVATDLSEARRFYLAAAKAGNADAMLALGQFAARGEGGSERSLTVAADWYAQAAAHGSAEAETSLGLLAEDGSLTGLPDPIAARAHFSRAADAGDPVAMERIGLMLLNETNGPRSTDLPSAIPPSTIPGSPEAVSPSRVEARTWLAKAFEAGRLGVAVSLAGLYLDRRAGPEEPRKARVTLEQAVAKGDAAAMIGLARLDFLGIGGQRDVAKAADWTERAVAAGRIDAYAAIAALYQADAAEGRHPDYASAYLWSQKGTLRSDPAAFYQMGTLYEGGFGRPIDFAKAEENFQRAADLGSAKASYALGEMADVGHGRAADPTRAAAYFKRAADLGDVPAMLRFGRMAEAGRGMTKDDAAALVAFTKALQLGSAEGYWRAALLTDAGRGGPRNPERAATYLIEAVVRQNADALAAAGGDLGVVSGACRISLKAQLVRRGLLSVASPGDAYDAPTRAALLAAARPAQ